MNPGLKFANSFGVQTQRMNELFIQRMNEVFIK
jgi:hypothetical protein